MDKTECPDKVGGKPNWNLEISMFENLLIYDRDALTSVSIIH
jgi:hypothetical protein